jgi:hypothetical protein
MKVVINRCYGGFSLSEKAYDCLGIPWDGYGYGVFSADRSNPKLVACVEALGKEADGQLAKLKIVDIPDGINWEIVEHDGMERVVERHLSWS